MRFLSAYVPFRNPWMLLWREVVGRSESRAPTAPDEDPRATWTPDVDESEEPEDPVEPETSVQLVEVDVDVDVDTELEDPEE